MRYGTSYQAQQVVNAPSVRQTGPQGPALVALGLGLAASLLALIIFQDTAKEQVGQDVMLFAAEIIKPPLYYVAHGMEIVLLLAAGLIALYRTDWSTLRARYLIWFLAFAGAGLLMTVRGYSLAELVSTKILDWTGPFPILVSVLIFIGVRRSNWMALGWLLMALAVVLSGLALWTIVNLQGFTRMNGVLNLTNILNALYWPGSWMALRDYKRRSMLRRFRFVPLAVFALGSLFTQTRMNFVMLAAAMGMYAFLQYRRRAPQIVLWVSAVLLAVTGGLLTATFFNDSQPVEVLQTVTTDFTNRLDEDTRTGQVVSFAEYVGASELILGRGSLASWNWPGMSAEYHGGTDIGYLTLLFFGGVPLLMTYIAVHLTSCLTLLHGSPDSLKLTASALVTLWALRMFSSSYPALDLEYYPVLLCVGACISRQAPPPRKSGPTVA